MKSLRRRDIWPSAATYTLSFLLPAAVLLAAYAGFGVFPFGEKSVLVTDMSQQYVDFHSWLYDAVKGGDSLFFSWNTGMGMNLTGIFSFYLASPFSLLVLLFERTQVQDALFFITLLKAACAGLTFSIFAKRILGLKNAQNITFSVMYATMSYVVVYALNIMWLDGVILLPLVALSLHSLMEKKRMAPFTICMTLCFLTQFYIGFMIAIFSAIYLVSELLRKKGLTLREFWTRFWRFALSGILAAGMAAVLLVPTYLSLQYVYYYIETGSVGPMVLNPLDVLGKLFFGSYDTITYGLPNLFCGMLTLLLLPLYFLNRSIEKRDKWVSAGVLAVFLISIMVWPINLLWHGGDEPTWFPYRYTFAVCFYMLLLAVKAFRSLDGVTWRHVAVSFAAPSAFAALMLLITGSDWLYDAMEGLGLKVLLPNTRTDVTVQVAAASAVLLALYGGVVLVMKYRPRMRELLCVGLCLLVSVEMFANASELIDSIDQELPYDNHSKYENHLRVTGEAVQAVKEMDDGWYRLENHDMRNANDALSLDYNGIAHYSSFTNQKTSRFVNHLGMVSNVQNRFWRYYGASTVTDSLFGVKYVLGSGERRAGFTQLKSLESGKHIYKNENALSLGYMVDSSLRDFTYDPEEYDPCKLQNELLCAMTGENKPVYTSIPLQETIPSDNLKITRQGEWDYIESQNGYAGTMRYRFVNPKSQNLCFSIKSAGLPDTSTVYVNGMPLNGTGYDFIGLMDLGYFEAGEEVVVSFSINRSPVMLQEPLLYGFDADRFSAMCRMLREHQMFAIEEGNSSVKGRVDAGEGGLLFTSIPADPGFSVTVDGESAQLVRIADAFLAVNLTAGEHEIEFTFVPEGLPLGGVVSVVSLAAGAVILWCNDTGRFAPGRKRRKRAAKGS